MISSQSPPTLHSRPLIFSHFLSFSTIFFSSLTLNTLLDDPPVSVISENGASRKGEEGVRHFCQYSRRLNAIKTTRVISQWRNFVPNSLALFLPLESYSSPMVFFHSLAPSYRSESSLVREAAWSSYTDIYGSPRKASVLPLSSILLLFLTLHTSSHTPSVTYIWNAGGKGDKLDKS